MTRAAAKLLAIVVAILCMAAIETASRDAWAAISQTEPAGQLIASFMGLDIIEKPDGRIVWK